MRPGRTVALALLLAGVLFGVGGLALIGAFGLLVDWLATLWSRRGLAGLTYERALERDRAVFGDRVRLRLTVHNAKLLPVPWLRVEDHVTDGIEIDDLPVDVSDRVGQAVVRTGWALGPYQRASRTGHVLANQRGVWTFERVGLRVADLFGGGMAEAEGDQRATLVVRPRTVPVQVVAPAWASTGSRRAVSPLPEDPDRFAGVRPFQRGDPRRRIHPRATARLGRPVSRRYEASRPRVVVIALDIQTTERPHWLLHFEADQVEGLIVAAASLARRHLAEGSAVGILVNGWTYRPTILAFLAPVSGSGQLARIEDLLGRLAPTASMPFERALGHLPGRVPADAVIEVVTARDLAAAAPALRRIGASGFSVRCVAMGPNRRESRRRGRARGLDVEEGVLAPDWRTSTALVVGAS